MPADSRRIGHEGEFGEVKVVLHFVCGACGASADFRASDEDEEGWLRCPSCGHAFRVVELPLREVQRQLDQVNATWKKFHEPLPS
jgi:DNA-directed RNA polymerase subunit RPC12/RpoP